jgi:hypothetical protein
VGQHIFLPSIGHVGQSETSEAASARGRSDNVYETGAWKHCAGIDIIKITTT